MSINRCNKRYLKDYIDIYDKELTLHDAHRCKDMVFSEVRIGLPSFLSISSMEDDRGIHPQATTNVAPALHKV